MTREWASRRWRARRDSELRRDLRAYGIAAVRIDSTGVQRIDPNDLFIDPNARSLDDIPSPMKLMSREDLARLFPDAKT